MLPLAVTANPCSTFFHFSLLRPKAQPCRAGPLARPSCDRGERPEATHPRDRFLRRGTQEPSPECIEGRRKVLVKMPRGRQIVG
jgi:hypothetical protein